MSRQIVGLWLGGAISVEAAKVVEKAIFDTAFSRSHDKVRFEMMDLANAIASEIQRAEPDDPSEGLI